MGDELPVVAAGRRVPVTERAGASMALWTCCTLHVKSGSSTVDIEHGSQQGLAPCHECS